MKLACPLLKKPAPRFKELSRSRVPVGENSGGNLIGQKDAVRSLLEGPHGFPPMFPQLSKQDQVMALQYISHSDEIERMARIYIVKQSIIDPKSSFPKISHEFDKGKGLVFGFENECERLKKRSLHGSKPLASAPDLDLQSSNNADPEHSFASLFVDTGLTVFKMGSFSKDPLSANLPAIKRGRNSPSAWKRRSRNAAHIPQNNKTNQEINQKRKAQVCLVEHHNKSTKTQDKMVAFDLKSLPTK